MKEDERKPIMLVRDEIKEMNFEEVVKQFDKFINKISNYYSSASREFEDLKQMALLEVWGAYKDYDISYNARFISVIYPRIERRFKKVIRYEMTQGRKLNRIALSYDKINEESSDLKEWLIDKPFEEDSITKIHYIETKNLISELDATIMDLIIAGYQQIEITKMVGLAQVTICRYVRRIRETLRAEFA